MTGRSGRGVCGPAMTPRFALPCLVALLLLPGLVRAQGVPSPASEPRTVEVEVQATDGGSAVSAEDARRLGLDGGEAALVPPALLADAPAAWPEGLAATAAEVTLELLVDEAGRVAEVKVTQGPEERRLVDAALAAAPHLRFSPATLGGRPVSVRLPFVYRFEPPPPAPARARLTGEVRA